MKTFRAYMGNVARFSPQARLYLLVSTLQGIGGGIFQLFFNFYILSLGYREDFVGMLISIPALTALLFAFIAGYISDVIGRKQTFILGGALSVISQLLMLLYPTQGMLIFSRVLAGIGSSFFSIASAPFLMEHSTEAERTYLFSFNSGISTVSSFMGNFVGGALPLFFALRFGVSETSSVAYAWSMGVTTLLMGVSLIPLFWLKPAPLASGQRPAAAAPLRALWEHRGVMTRLLLPTLIISLGAGLLIPFMNIFFRNHFALSDAAIGQLFGFGSLGMGIAFLVAPVLAEKWGKARTVVITQGLSIPFLIIMGFVPYLPLVILAYFVRMALMNLSSPVYQTMVMEEANEESRGMAASLYSMIWSSGRALSPSISGPIQVAYGFNPIFTATIVSYAVSVALVWAWFVRGRDVAPVVGLQARPNLAE